MMGAIKQWLASALAGLGLLGLVQLLGLWQGSVLAAGTAAVAVCWVLGLPGMVTLLLLRVILLL